MRRRSQYLLALLLAAALVNLPLLHGTWTDLRIDRDGVAVTASVVDHRAPDGQHVLAFRLPEDVDPERRTWSADVEEDAYDRAVDRGDVAVRVVEGDPAVHRVDGQVSGSGMLVITLLVDVLLVAAALLLWRSGGRRRPQLRAIAVGDVERCPPGSVLDRIEGETYLVRGEVAELAADRVVLELGDRSVLVLLDGHRNPVGHQQAAQVRARLV